MRGILAGVVVAGCTFHPGASSGGDDAAGGGADVGNLGGDAGDATSVPFCDLGDSTLLACYELEGTTQDASANGLDPTTMNVGFVPGRAGMAVAINAMSVMDVPETPALDVAYLTIEAWIRPSTIPSARAGIIDNEGQYSLYLYAGGELRCRGFQLPANIQAGVWTHVACTYDGTIRIYVDGSMIGDNGGGGGPLSGGGTTGMSIGADNPPGSGQQLLGELDQLRMFSAARTSQQICAAAGRTSCP